MLCNTDAACERGRCTSSANRRTSCGWKRCGARALVRRPSCVGGRERPSSSRCYGCALLRDRRPPGHTRESGAGPRRLAAGLKLAGKRGRSLCRAAEGSLGHAERLLASAESALNCLGVEVTEHCWPVAVDFALRPLRGRPCRSGLVSRPAERDSIHAAVAASASEEEPSNWPYWPCSAPSRKIPLGLEAEKVQSASVPWRSTLRINYLESDFVEAGTQCDRRTRARRGLPLMVGDVTIKTFRCMAFNGRHLLVGFASGIEAEDEGIVPRSVPRHFPLRSVSRLRRSPLRAEAPSAVALPSHAVGVRIHTRISTSSLPAAGGRSSAVRSPLKACRADCNPWRPRTVGRTVAIVTTPQRSQWGDGHL